MHHTKTIGDVAELLAAAKYIEKGYVVSRPLTDHARYDLLIDDGNNILKVQVKARSMKNGSVAVQKYTSNKAYEDGDFDILVVYCIDTGEIAALNWDELLTSDTILRIDPPKNNQLKNVRFFKDFYI